MLLRFLPIAFATQELDKVLSKLRAGKAIDNWVNARVEHRQQNGNLMSGTVHHLIW